MLGARTLHGGARRVAPTGVKRDISLAAIVAKLGGFGGPTVSKDLKVPPKIPTVTKLEWSSPLKVVKYPDPRLRAVNAKVGVFDESLMQLAKEMIAVMYTDDGVGLAAPQVGVNVRVMVFNPVGREKPGNEVILVNPEIMSQSGPRGTLEEGCLSFPKIFGEVDRPTDIVVKAQNEKGEAMQLKLGGPTDEGVWLSRIFQHEYDHLQGILFHDRMGKDVVTGVRERLVAMEEEFVAANPGVKVQRLPAPKKPGF
ncbi:hypothetical protein FOA52_001216 [Chlamydomonas sp. UWO 241]|nr:hypothetical protein FOA52_001216 [Chlamydomonas sp. UWO 241]